MEKLKLLVSLSHKFCLRYAREYFKMLLKPIVVGAIGFIFVPLCMVNPVLGLLPIIITLPCIFYSFWRGFCVTYLLNYGALNFVKNEATFELKAYENSFKAQEQDFAKYISFCAILVLACFVPCVFFVFKNISLLAGANPDFGMILKEFLGALFYSFIISIILIPFTNYFTQSYFFKKDHENYFNLFLNCYKNLDKEGLIIACGIALTTFIIASMNMLFWPLLIVLNLYYYSINTFWYYSKIKAQPLN